MTEEHQSGERDQLPVDFGRSAVDYERHRPGFPEGFFDRLVQSGWAVPGTRALDLGTGTGTVALGLASRGLNVVGIDVSPDLLAVATRRAEDRRLSASFSVARAEATGQDDEQFDLVTAGQCWWWFDSDAAIREADRILAPGGRLLICSFSYLPMAGNVAGRTEDLILGHNPGWPKAGWRGVHPEQVRALDEGGFKDVESSSYTVDVAFSHEGWRGRMRTCNGVGSSLPPERIERFDAALADMLANEFPGELLIPHRIFATSGLKP